MSPSAVWVHDSPVCSEEPARLESTIREYAQEVAYYGCPSVKWLKSVSALAESRGITARRVASIRSAQALHEIERLSPDLILIGGGWPERIPPEILEQPRMGAMNVHPSLLPDFRGTDVHRWQILAGVETSGVSVHIVEEEFDTGRLVSQGAINLDGRETPQGLVDKLALLSGSVVEVALDRIRIARDPQAAGWMQPGDESFGYCGRWPWPDADFLRLDWIKPSVELERLVRASTQESLKYNGPHFAFGGHHCMVRASKVVPGNVDAEPGTVMECSMEAITVACGVGALALTTLQPYRLEEWNGHRFAQPAMDPTTLACAFNLRPGSRLA